MNFIGARPYADTAARKLMELANAFQSIQDGRIYIEKINDPFLFELKGTPSEYRADLHHCIATGSLVMHENGTYCTAHRGGRGVVYVPCPTGQ